VMGGSVTLSFATGNVTVEDEINFVDVSRKIGIGGFVGLLSGTVTNVTKCFAGGAVRAENVGNIKLQTPGLGSLMFGVGGFAGINERVLSSCYSSSSVFAHYTKAVSGAANSLVGVGIGGVVGVSQNTVSDAYSSGSVLRETDFPITSDTNQTYFEKAIGGVVGTKAGNTNTYSQLYFDIWNNSYGSDLTAIGGQADSDVVRALTTDQMCISQTEYATGNEPLKLLDGIWSFNKGAYPCLLALVQPGVSDYIRYPAVLSVVAVIPDSRDISARTGNGITMAITTPASLTVLGVLYELEWSAATDSDVSFIETEVATLSKFTPVRTANASQMLSLIAEIKDKAEYGSRRFDRLCAEMRGTQEKPYLISHKSDLQHIGLPTYDDYQVDGFDGYYNQWYSPLNDSLVNVAGIVHFKLLSDIDMRLDVNYTYNSGEDRLDVVVNSAGDGNRDNDNHHIPYLTNVSYNGIIFEGISFAGNDYSIDYFKSAREFIFGISSVSTISDISFENLQIDSTGTVDEDLGTALVRYNQGTIDGCMILSGDMKGGNNVASIVVNNQATLKNSTVKASITGNANVGGIVANNIDGATIANCAFDDGLITVNQIVGEDAKAGAIAGSNSGTISNCFSMGSIVSTNYANVIGGLVGENTSTGIIGPAYSRTHVSGGDNIGGFVGTNAGTITNAFSAGRVTLSPGYTQTGIFCGDNTGTLTDTFADKAMAGKSTFALLDDVTTTQELMDMTCFSTTGTASNVFTESSTKSAYPQLTAILALDNGYATGAYIPQKFELLIGYSILSSAAIKTKYSQYIDTLALSTANPVSTITTTESTESWLTDVSWSTNDLSIIDAEGLTTATSGSTTLTASITINASNGKTHPITMPIAVTTGDQNPNFNGGNGSESNPYEINSTSSFGALAYYGPDGETAYKLTDDVNYGNSCPTPVITTFSGTLDGDKHVVYDLTLDDDSAGLFGHLNGATVSNLGLVGAKKVTTVPGDYAGLLAGLAQDATITNCYAIGEINTNAAHMGGLVGAATADTTITGCMTSGKFVNTSTDSEANTGGIAGSADWATINESFSTAYVLGKGVVGGIVGEAINTSEIENCTFAGMVMDSTLAGGASAPDITTIGNIVGSKSEDSTITDCAYDKQITLIADANATAKFTGELMTGSAYTVHTGLADGSVKFAAGVAFGTMPIRFLLGTAAGSTQNFSGISIPATVANYAVSVTEVPRSGNSESFDISAGTSSPTIVTTKQDIDFTVVFSGLEAVVAITGIATPISRYVEPRLNRIVGVSYTLTNPTGVTALNSQTVAVQIKNKHKFAGEPVTYSSDAFTTAESTPAQFEDLVVSSGGIYAGGNLPKGYAYQITATDQNNSSLPVATTDGEYGTYVALKDDTTGIKLSYTIIKNEPWGVFVYWSSLVDTLVKQ
ncbi:MAG TPA: GLUG motif-containing protein, partial [Clostridia bacterium]|nr:GLUG motif-containing protein [Clostridia bacterium]